MQQKQLLQITVTAIRQVDAAKEALQKAKDDLKEAEKPVNRSKLEEAYNKYKDLKNDGYTENSWKTFKNALDAAKAVLEYEDATAEQQLLWLA